jgi:hypothetical protein
MNKVTFAAVLAVALAGCGAVESVPTIATLPGGEPALGAMAAVAAPRSAAWESAHAAVAQVRMHHQGNEVVRQKADELAALLVGGAGDEELGAAVEGVRAAMESR